LFLSFFKIKSNFQHFLRSKENVLLGEVIGFSNNFKIKGKFNGEMGEAASTAI